MQKLLTPEEAAPLCGVTAKALEDWRGRGVGPRFIRSGRLVRYDPEDIADWRNKRRVASTSEKVAA